MLKKVGIGLVRTSQIIKSEAIKILINKEKVFRILECQTIILNKIIL